MKSRKSNCEGTHLRLNKLTQLLKISEQVHAGMRLEEVLEQVYESFRAVVPYDRIGVALLEESARGTLVRSRWGKSERADLKLLPGYAAPLSGSSLECIIRTGQPRIINDLEEYLAAHPRSESTRIILAEGIRSNLTCPLQVKGKRIGFLFFSSIQKSAYKDLHVDLFMQLAAQVSAAIEKSRLYDELLEMNRLYNRFIGIAAHDLRGPLGIMSGALTLLLEDSGKDRFDSGQLELLGLIEHASSHMLELVNTLLDTSAVQAGCLHLNKVEMEVADLFRKICVGYQVLGRPRDVLVHFRTTGDLPRLSLDADRIQQVLGNLIGNAMKYSPEGGRIDVHARMENGEVRVSVTDQGPGVPEAERDEIFGEFRQARQNRSGQKGVGLGLAIARRMIEAHGGRLWLESAAPSPCGATFSFSLPVSKE